MVNLLRALAAIGAACLAAAAQGHPLLDHAEPRVGAIVPSAPTELKIWFTQELKPVSSTIEVADASGKRVAAGPAHADPHDPRLLAVPLATLAPGQYTVVWRVMSVDTHAAQGRFTFRVSQ